MKLFYVLVLVIAYTPLQASEPLSFGQAKRQLIKLYKAHPEATTFYCGCRINWKGKKGIPDAESCGYTPRKAVTNSGNPNSRATRVEWEHVMPAYWFGHRLQCWQEGGRKACKKIRRFREMENVRMIGKTESNLSKWIALVHSGN